MKPLYLHAKGRLVVSLDGPALRISRSGCADQRFPFRRISRVMVSGDASWSTDALLACADEGISVCFLKADGRPRARWFGRATKRNALAQRWQDFLDRPDWSDLYTQWRIALSRRAVRLCAWRMGWSPAEDPRTINEAIRDATRNVANTAELRTVRKRLYGLAQARAFEELGKEGLDAEDVSVTHLVPDLVTTIQWGLRPELTRWLARGSRPGDRKHVEPGHDSRSAAVFFEHHSALVDFHLRDTIGRLQRYLECLQ